MRTLNNWFKSDTNFGKDSLYLYKNVYGQVAALVECHEFRMENTAIKW